MQGSGILLLHNRWRTPRPKNSQETRKTSKPPRFLHSRGVPAPISWRRMRLKLKAPTWISCRFRMFLRVNTQDSYLRQVSQFARHFGRSPTFWARKRFAPTRSISHKRRSSLPAVTIAVSALRFLYKVTLRREWTSTTSSPLPRHPRNCLSSSVPRRCWSSSAGCRKANTAPF